MITREFDLPLELLFKAYAEPELVDQWMGTKVLKLESKKHGSYRFEKRILRVKCYFMLMGLSMSLSLNGKSPEYLKWEIPHLEFSLRFINLKNLLMIPANSPCMCSMNQLH